MRSRDRVFGLSVSLFVTRAPRGRVVGRFVCLFVSLSVCPLFFCLFSLPRSSRVYIWFRKGGSGEINQR